MPKVPPYKLDEMKIIRHVTKQLLNNPPVTVINNMQVRVEAARKRLEKAFENHPITQEIEAGPDANNTSNTLGGYGNLFSFLGFYAGSSPLAVIRDFIGGITVSEKPTGKMVGKDKIHYNFHVFSPVSKEDLFDQTELEWLGKSWLKGIESGLSGLGYYLFFPDGADQDSRSEMGLQSQKNKIRSLTYRPTKYFSALLWSFKMDLNKIS